jgi:hypothetical protein
MFSTCTAGLPYKREPVCVRAVARLIWIVAFEADRQTEKNSLNCTRFLRCTSTMEASESDCEKKRRKLASCCLYS